MFLFAVMPFLAEGKKSRLWMAPMAVFMHFSFIFPLTVLVIYIIAGARKNLYFIFFIVTFFISALDLSVVRDNLTGFAPDIFQKRVSSYTNEGYLSNVSEDLSAVNWYIAWYGKALNWTIMLLLAFIFFKGNRSLLANKHYNSIFSFSLFFYGWADVAGFLPSGGRFISIAQMLGVFSILVYLQYAKQSGWMRRAVYVLSPLLFFYLVVSIRIGFDSLSVSTILGNPVIALFGNDNTALIELIK